MLPAFVSALVDAAQASPYAPAYVACLLVLSGVVPIPGFGGLLLACGYTFGFTKGLAIAYPSAIMGAALGFALGRRYPPSRIPSKIADLQDVLGECGFATLLLLRLTPLPFALSSLFFGSVPQISAWKHAAATAVGFVRLPLNVYVGAQLGRAAEGGIAERAAGGIGAVAAALAVGSIANKLLQRRRVAAAAPRRPATRSQRKVD